MEPAAQRLAERMADVAIRTPDIRYVSAVDGLEHSDPGDIRALLGRQLARPVYWTQTVRALLASGVQALIECGPGKVLTGLNRRIERRADLACLALEDADAVSAALALSVESTDA